MTISRYLSGRAAGDGLRIAGAQIERPLAHIHRETRLAQRAADLDYWIALGLTAIYHAVEAKNPANVNLDTLMITVPMPWTERGRILWPTAPDADASIAPPSQTEARACGKWLRANHQHLLMAGQGGGPVYFRARWYVNAEHYPDRATVRRWYSNPANRITVDFLVACHNRRARQQATYRARAGR